MIKNIAIDINKLIADIENLKKDIENGVKEGFDDSKSYVAELMKNNIKSEVYNVYEPKQYGRTEDLLNSVVAESNVSDIPNFKTNTNLWVYSDPNKLTGSYGKTVGGRMTEHGKLPYSFRVFYGDDIYRYEYHPKNGSFAPYMAARDWVTPTADAIILGKTFMSYIINAIKRNTKVVK